mgnify:CR=1 FL=1
MNIALNGMQSIELNTDFSISNVDALPLHRLIHRLYYACIFYDEKNLILALDLPSFRASHTQLVMVYGVTGLRQWNAVAWQLWLFVVSYLAIYKLLYIFIKDYKCVF